MRRITVLLSALLLGWCASAFAAEPVATNAVDGILAAFQSRPLVGLGEWHGMAQELDFYSALIRDPRFAADVGNVVMESGNAAEQATVDRYVNGENVPYAQLRKVWADTAGFDPTQFFLGTINVYDTIRMANAKLPPEKRIKVWLADPPIDWSKVHAKAELDEIEAQRETYPASVINQQILDKGKKALVIYGTNHLSVFTNGPQVSNLRALVEKAHPGAFFIVMPYVGFTTKACAAPFEKHMANWPTPALIAPLRGTSLEADLLPPGCGAMPILKGMAQDEYDTIMRNMAGLTSDALLYLGPRDKMLWSAWNPDIYLDLDFRAELDRRHIIRGNKPMGNGWRANSNPSVPQPYFEN